MGVRVLACTLGALSAFLLAAPAPPSSQTNPCPVFCPPQGDDSYSSGSGCATVEFVPIAGAGAAGKASEYCDGTCRVCSQLVQMTVNCTACTNGCTYVWENHSFDEDGSAEQPLSGTGTSTGIWSVTQKLTTSCNGPTALFGISVSGLLRIYQLTCPCVD